jgi:hypothetical protein
MMRKIWLPTFVAALAMVASACGGDAEIEVSDVWARTSARTQDAGAVYMTISGGEADDRLIGVSVSSNVAGMAQIHETSMDDDGVMMMQPVVEIGVPADGEVMLEPGGFHVMLMNLADPLETGETIDVTLTFEDAGTVEVSAEVREN